MTAKIRMTALVCMMVLSVGGLALATPVIKDFSSKGGRTTNKTGPKDTMYLVKAGDKITFSVTANGAQKYVWQVNKKAVAEATARLSSPKSGNLFVWPVPKAKGIWEIHLKVAAGDKSVHQEWVVSTLSKSEAPAVFEYFADKKFRDRTETDPWGRKLPEWRIPGLWNPQTKGKVVTSECVMRGLTPHKNYRYNRLRYEYPRRLDAYGTWVFWFRYPIDSTVPYMGYSVRIIDDRKPLKDYGFWHITESWDTHAWINIDARDENKIRRGNIVL
ncbi:MAG: hypothetical protein KAV00_06325, partial [Phycisphaerae bacterium]|nr:hypothetical protein [Phycisphaerae bacterium]